jgi:hypothetical protein
MQLMGLEPLSGHGFHDYLAATKMLVMISAKSVGMSKANAFIKLGII